MLLFLLAVLLLLFIVLVVVQIKKAYRGLGQALGLFLLVVLAGVWSIAQSASSTAGIGLLFLPFYGLFAALLAGLSAHLRNALRPGWRILGWLTLLGALAVPATLIVGGIQTMQRQAIRNAQHQADGQEIARNKAQIKAALAQQPGREAEIIEQLLSTHAGHRNYLLPLLESPFVRAEALDRMADADDLGIALTAIRNPNCPPATLTRIYRTHHYPDYFFQALASHSNTPAPVLAELYRRPPTINGLDASFAANPATPREILVDIAERTTESFVVQRLLANPAIDCALLTLTEQALQRTERPDDNHSRWRLQAVRQNLCTAR